MAHFPASLEQRMGIERTSCSIEAVNAEKESFEQLITCKGKNAKDNKGRLPIAAYGSPSDTKIMLPNYAYHVTSGTWEQLDWSVFGIGFKPIGVGNYIYYSFEGILVAANMTTRYLSEGKIKGSRLGVGKGLCAEPELVHLGGKDFCFFTLQSRRSGRTKVRCTKFRVSKLVRPPSRKYNGGMFGMIGSLKGFVVRSVSFVLDEPLALTGHGLLLDGMSVDSIRINDEEVEEEVSGDVTTKFGLDFAHHIKFKEEGDD